MPPTRDERADRFAPHGTRHGDGHGQLHVAGAGEGPRSRSPVGRSSFGAVLYEMLGRAPSSATRAGDADGDLREEPAELSGANPHRSGARRPRAALSRKEPRGTVPVGAGPAYALDALVFVRQRQRRHGSRERGRTAAPRRRSILGGPRRLASRRARRGRLPEAEGRRAPDFQVLTVSGNDTQPTVSPDGKTIAFMSGAMERIGSGSCSARAAGKGPDRGTERHFPRFSGRLLPRLHPHCRRERDLPRADRGWRGAQDRRAGAGGGLVSRRTRDRVPERRGARGQARLVHPPDRRGRRERAARREGAGPLADQSALVAGRPDAGRFRRCRDRHGAPEDRSLSARREAAEVPRGAGGRHAPRVCLERGQPRPDSSRARVGCAGWIADDARLPEECEDRKGPAAPLRHRSAQQRGGPRPWIPRSGDGRSPVQPEGSLADGDRRGRALADAGQQHRSSAGLCARGSGRSRRTGAGTRLWEVSTKTGPCAG